MEKDIYGFDQFLLVRRGLQPITIQSYVKCIKRIIKAIGTPYPTHDQIEDYVAKFYRAGYSYSHKTNTIIAIEHWMEYIGNPIKLGRQQKPKSIIKNTLSEAEVTKLIFNCRNIRESAIITLVAYAGLRNKELCNLRVQDVDFGNNSVRVLEGKGTKDGIASISAECTRVLIQYLTEYPRPREEYLFTTLEHGNKYHPCDLRKLFRKVAERAGIQKRVYPHLMRHTLAMNMLARGAGIYTIKEQLRHSFVDTTLIYVNSLVPGTRNEYDKFVPSYV